MDLEPTAEIKRALPQVRTAQRISTADQETNGSQAPDQNENEAQCFSASVTRPTALSGETPATRATAARTDACYGCAIPLRTLWHHPHLRWWTRAAAHRRRAAGKLRLTTAARYSSAANIPAGCPSYWELLGTYLDDAGSRRRAVQLRRRRSAAATMVSTWRRCPEPKEGAHVIKTEPIPPTDATRERNWREEGSPTLETKNSELGRKWGFPKSAPTCGGETKLTEG